MDRPNLIGNPSISNPSVQEWFNVKAFSIPAPDTFGSAGRNILRGPGLSTTDLSLRRSFILRGESRITSEVHAARFFFVMLSTDQPLTFGKIFSAKDPRQIQFSLRLAF